MQAYPHHYHVNAAAESTGSVNLTSPGVATIESAPPPEFGGPGDVWSPETLLVAAVADCFVLSFRAIARASKLDWHALSCEVDGVLDQVERHTRFTHINLQARLTVPNGVDNVKAQRLLEKAEAGCLITNSMSAEIHLKSEIQHVSN